MANKPISTAPTTMGRHGRLHEEEAERAKGVTFQGGTSRAERIHDDIDSPPEPEGVTFGEPRAPDGSPDSKGVPKNIAVGEPHPPTAPKTETSREERIAAGIETPSKPHPKPQSFQQPERQPDTPPAGPPLTRAELVGDVETPVDARTVQQAEEERLAKQQRLTDEIDIEVAHRREAKRKQAEADKAKAEADAKARTNQTVAKK